MNSVQDSAHKAAANFGMNHDSHAERQHRAEKVYRHLPVWAQNLAISFYGMSYRRERLGGVFEQCVAEFQSRDRWPQARMKQFLELRLPSVLSRAFREVPYYSQKWKSAGLSSLDLARITPAELPRLPITPKRDLVGNAHLFVAGDVAASKKLNRYYSSGSTGTPVTSIVSAEDHQRFIAAREVRSLGWAGTSLRWPRSMVGGRIVVPDPESTGPYYRYNWAERQVYFSAFHISPEHVSGYLEGFHRYRPMLLTGYAHSHYTLARMMLDRGLTLSYSPAALVLGSEKLTAEMKSVIQQAFRARAYEEYGCVEQCALATECEFGNLHVNSDFGIIEIVDDQGIPVPVGRPGRIVCTGLLSETQPLIRYEIGDCGILSETSCACGRDHLPVLREISGRSEDVVVGRDGREVVRFHGLFVDLPYVWEGQVIQESLDLIRVRVVARPGFGHSEEQTIVARLRERLGPLEVRVEQVREIERTARGKFRAVISRLPRNQSQPPVIN